MQNDAPAPPPPPPSQPASTMQEPTDTLQEPTANSSVQNDAPSDLTQLALDMLAALPLLF